jgi:hypothetical protein
MKEATEKPNMFKTTKIFQPKLLKLKETNNFNTNENPVNVLNYTNKIKLQSYSQISKKKLEEYNVSDNSSIKEGKFS